jgi:ribosomal protein S12 methylthiotransferase
MPLQHISDSVLLRMGRKIGEKETRKAVEMISRNANCAIRTTFMLGFPGETAEDFRKLYDFTEEQRFARMGAFVYSPEQGTPAAEMPDQVSAVTAKRRYGKLMRLQQMISYEANKALIGGMVKVIFDQAPVRGIAKARTVFDAPDIDNDVLVRKCPAGILPGMTASVLVTGADAYGLKTEYLQCKK